MVSLLNRPDKDTFQAFRTTRPLAPTKGAAATPVRSRSSSDRHEAGSPAASSRRAKPARPGDREIIVLSEPRFIEAPRSAAPVQPRRTTWSCLTRQRGMPWRVSPPTGPAMPARWAIGPTSTTAPAKPKAKSSVAQRPPLESPAAAIEALPTKAVVGSEAMPVSFSFGELKLAKPVLQAIWEMGYRTPSPIQAKAVPVLLAGKDVVGQAQTGTGKTAAFGLPIVERVDAARREVQALVLLPTRELCRQVALELERISTHRGLHVLAVYGGEGMERQLRALREGVHIVVGTPGRVQDHIWRGTLKLDAVHFAVLDEADEMLDVGFAEDIERILRCVPTERQTALFSATIPPFVHTLVRRYLKDPEWLSTVDHSVSASARIPKQIQQSYVQVAERDKLAAVEELIRSEQGYDRVLVFRRMKISADRLAQSLSRKGYSVKALHGDLPQGERNRVLEDFRAGRIQFLVATNVAARGLDINDVSHVLNYDLPDTPEEYVHRIGRTGRAGKTGTAISFVAEWDLDTFENIKQHVGDRLEERHLSLYS